MISRQLLVFLVLVVSAHCLRGALWRSSNRQKSQAKEKPCIEYEFPVPCADDETSVCNVQTICPGPRPAPHPAPRGGRHPRHIHH